MECGTLCDVERGRVWSVGWNMERCTIWNEVRYVVVEVVLYEM